MLLNMIRAIFVLVVAGLAARLAKGTGTTSWALLFSGAMTVALVALVIDILTPRKRIQTISAVYFGLIVGLILGYFLQVAVEPALGMLFVPDVQQGLTGILTVIICYMEFSKEVKGARPLVLDTSVIIDGRIADVVEARVIDQPLVVPRFVLQ